MNKLLAGLLLFISCAVMAVPVAQKVERSGKVVLMNDKCPFAPDAFKFQVYDPKGKETFSGCWLEVQPQILWLVSETGNNLLIEKEAFDWFKAL